ncbi:TIR domain-containing protein [Ahrensia marina]|nr:TIR domain-containing protein [Ahrensia marina]
MSKKWDVNSVRDVLHNNEVEILEESPMSNGHGHQFKGSDGEVICIYNSGKLVIQGKNQDRVKSIFGLSISPKSKDSAPVAANGNRKVFVVYGHDVAAKTQLEAMLRRWGLEPLILDQLTSGGQTIIEKLERVRSDANFAVVLATPDDEGHRAEHPEEKAHRARQNVVLELGMMLSVLGRDRVAVLMKDQIQMERPSDIQGVIYIPFKEDVSESALSLAKEISSKGIHIDLSKV